METEEIMALPDIGDRLDNLMKRLGTNYNALYKKMELSTPDVFYKIREGKSKPRYETLAKIKELYPQVNMNYFFDEKVTEPFVTDDATNDQLRALVKDFNRKTTDLL